MAKQLDLKIKSRAKGTKGELNQLREDGYIPAVLYGYNINLNIKVNKKEFFTKVMSSIEDHIIFNLMLDGEPSPITAIIKDRFIDSLKQELYHIDFYSVDMNKPIELSSEFRINGIASGVKKGGIIEVRMTKIKGKALPIIYPKYIDVDVLNLEIGDSIQIKDVIIPDGLTLFANLEDTVLVVALPKSMRGGGSQNKVVGEEPVSEVNS